MAFPANGFAYATGALASSGYSDGVLVVDLSELPADWWNAIDTADTTKARFGIGGTEVAGWIDPETFVNNMDGSGDGVAYIYYSSVSAVTGQVAGIQPPKAANSSYAAGDTYGRNAVFAHADAWYPMTEDPSGGSILDATGNGNTGTVVGSLTSAGAAGIEFPGTNGNAIEIPNLVNGAGAWTVAARFNADNLSTIGGLGRRIFNSTGDSGNIEADLDVSSNFRAYIYQYAYAFNFTTGSPSTATDYWAEFSWGDDGASLTINGTEIASSASTTGISGATKTFIGGVWIQAAGQPEGAFDGVIGGVAIYPFSRPAAARAHTYANESDPATFWGTWTWEAPVAPTTIYQRRRPGIYRVGSRSVA